ncbi:MAG: hypothetical protein HQ509_12450 [Candidatus Marinimicrobia bacterium]|nr:hypothetical protein [Candidatus Neomarinimicrobiota bacterium]
MATVETLNEIANTFLSEDKVEISKWFGKPCLKSQNKVFLVLWGKDLAFKLTGMAHVNALALPKARLFDPRGKGSAMREWVHVDIKDSDVLKEFVQHAFNYVIEQG